MKQISNDRAWGPLFTVPVILALPISAANFYFYYNLERSGEKNSTYPVVAPVLDRSNLENRNQESYRLASETSRLEGMISSIEAEMDDLHKKIHVIIHDRKAPSNSQTQNEANNNQHDIIQEQELFGDQVDTEWHSELEMLEDMVYSEETDLSWSSLVGETISEVLSRPEMQGVELVGNHCSLEICRLQLSFDPSSVNPESVDELVIRAADWGQGIINVSEEDSTATFYFARNGSSLNLSR